MFKILVQIDFIIKRIWAHFPDYFRHFFFFAFDPEIQISQQPALIKPFTYKFMFSYIIWLNGFTIKFDGWFDILVFNESFIIPAFVLAVSQMTTEEKKTFIYELKAYGCTSLYRWQLHASAHAIRIMEFDLLD